MIYVKISKIGNLHLIIYKNLILKMYNTQVQHNPFSKTSNIIRLFLLHFITFDVFFLHFYSNTFSYLLLLRVLNF
jgi:hypothetical protein